MDTLQNIAGGLDVFMRTIGIDVMTGIGFTAQVAIGLQSILIVFFVISPVLGIVLARNIEKRTDVVIAWGTGMAVMLIGTFGFAYVLRGLIPEERLPDGIFALLMSVGSVCAGILIARYIGWWLAPPGETGWIREFREQAQADMSAIERSHRQHVKAGAPDQRVSNRAKRVEKSIYNRKQR